VKQHTFVDATAEEELSTSSRITFAYDGEENICAIRQDGEAELEFTQLESLIDVRDHIALSLPSISLTHRPRAFPSFN
jgi:exosome complex RNA-binding protein Rrp42 (RNase PH superfamily)